MWKIILFQPEQLTSPLGLVGLAVLVATLGQLAVNLFLMEPLLLLVVVVVLIHLHTVTGLQVVVVVRKMLQPILGFR
jgi:hypothetical protein